MIIFDENVDQVLIDLLELDNSDVFSIRKHLPGCSDLDVIEIVKTKKGLLITEDKDFGELVFSHNIKDCTIILLRYNKPDYEQIQKNLIKAILDYHNNPDHFFITITKMQIRIRKI